MSETIQGRPESDFWDDPTTLDIIAILRARAALAQLGVDVGGGEYLKDIDPSLLDGELIRKMLGD